MNVRTPHWISADLDLSMSAHTGFADVNPPIFVGFADLETAKTRFADLNIAKKLDSWTSIQ